MALLYTQYFLYLYMQTTNHSLKYHMKIHDEVMKRLYHTAIVPSYAETKHTTHTSTKVCRTCITSSTLSCLMLP